MKTRTTVNVDQVRAIVNGMLRNTEDSDQAGRESVIELLERILHDTGNYRGFRYLSSDDMKDSVNGTSVGIGPFVSDSVEDIRARFNNTDHTRVVFC